MNRSLLNVFFLTDRNKKDTGVEDSKLQPSTIGSVGVIGAGIMGAGIAAANVKRNILATITDTRPEALADGVQKVLDEVAFNEDNSRKGYREGHRVRAASQRNGIDGRIGGL